jgi:hypothetical protein
MTIWIVFRCPVKQLSEAIISDLTSVGVEPIMYTGYTI